MQLRGGLTISNLSSLLTVGANVAASCGELSKAGQSVVRLKLKEPKVFSGCLSDVEVVRLVEACPCYRDKLILLTQQL